MHRPNTFALISTYQHNVGDDFIRAGIQHLLDQILPLRTDLGVHKHAPFTVREEFAWMYDSGLLPTVKNFFGWNGYRRISYLLDSVPPISRWDKISKSSVIVQCGTPIFSIQNNSQFIEEAWFDLIMRRRIGPAKNSKILLNLAAGSCIPYGMSPEEFVTLPSARRFIEEFFDLADLTTVRDPIALQMHHLLHREPECLPCTAIFAKDFLGLVKENPSYVCLNFMPAGGHFYGDPSFDPSAWGSVISEFSRAVARNYPVVLVCHDQAEVRFAEMYLPELPRFFSRRWEDYVACYSRGIVGVCCRVHAAILLASYGIPVFLLGNDSRTSSIDLFGLRRAHFQHISASRLTEEFDWLLEQRDVFSQSQSQFAEKSKSRYLELMSKVLLRAENGLETC